MPFPPQKSRAGRRCTKHPMSYFFLDFFNAFLGSFLDMGSKKTPPKKLPKNRPGAQKKYPHDLPNAACRLYPCSMPPLVACCPLPDRPPPTTTTRQPSTGQGATREGKKTTYLPTYLFLQKISKNTSDFFIVFLEKKSVLDFWSILFLKLFDTILFAKRFL
jgi:hypothetical protein